MNELDFKNTNYLILQATFSLALPSIFPYIFLFINSSMGESEVGRASTESARGIGKRRLTIMAAPPITQSTAYYADATLPDAAGVHTEHPQNVCVVQTLTRTKSTLFVITKKTNKQTNKQTNKHINKAKNKQKQNTKIKKTKSLSCGSKIKIARSSPGPVQLNQTVSSRLTFSA